MQATKEPISLNSRIRLNFFFVAFIIGIIHAWAVRDAVDPDGVSYLDVGDSFFSSPWNKALNPYWSPLYPIIQGFVLHIFKVNASWESIFIHLVNFIIFLFAFFFFDYFLQGLIHLHKDTPSRNDLITLPEWAYLCLGYS